MWVLSDVLGESLEINGITVADFRHTSQSTRLLWWQIYGFSNLPPFRTQLLVEIVVLALGDNIKFIGTSNKHLNGDTPITLQVY